MRRHRIDHAAVRLLPCIALCDRFGKDRLYRRHGGAQ
jgi:hypothetical protein